MIKPIGKAMIISATYSGVRAFGCRQAQDRAQRRQPPEDTGDRPFAGFFPGIGLVCDQQSEQPKAEEADIAKLAELLRVWFEINLDHGSRPFINYRASTPDR